VKKVLDAGELVPDAVVTDLLRERIVQQDCERGFVLDGFPRTLPQASSLEAILEERGEPLDAVIYYSAPEEVVVERLSGRRMCRQCGANFHVRFRPPKREGLCDECGGKLYTRSDDAPQTIRERLRVYLESTEALVDYYRRRGLLVEVSAAADPEEVERRSRTALAACGLGSGRDDHREIGA
jgi:adenylate kinase